MPTFQTPEPITLRVKVASGDVRVEASPRSDTVVDVQPESPRREADVEAAAQTRVDHRDGTVVVEAPDGHRHSSGSIRVLVQLPEESRLTANSASADVRVDGRLSDIEITTASGDQRIDQVSGNVNVTAASGDIFCGPIDGDARIQSASGDLDLSSVGGTATISSASGDIRLPSVGGDARITSASGDLEVGTVGGSTSVKTASGDVQLSSVSNGKVTVESASGDVSIGVAAGTAAWLDVHSLSGDISTSLEDSSGPDESDQQVEIRVNTVSGDIRVHRA